MGFIRLLGFLALHFRRLTRNVVETVADESAGQIWLEMTGGLFGKQQWTLDKVDMGRGGICPDSSPSASLSPCLDVPLQMQLPVKPCAMCQVQI